MRLVWPRSNGVVFQVSTEAPWYYLIFPPMCYYRGIFLLTQRSYLTEDISADDEFLKVRKRRHAHHAYRRHPMPSGGQLVTHVLCCARIVHPSGHQLAAH